MPLPNDFLITIHNGGDKAVAAVQRMGDDWRAQLEQAADEIERLREAIRRLAEQDATLSVCEGNVTVEMDATLTDAERSAIRDAADRYASLTPESAETAATLLGLVERL